MEPIDFLCCKEDDEEFQDYLNEETDFYKIYMMDLGSSCLRRHVAKIDEKTGLPKYLANQRIKFGITPVKNAYLKVEDGK